MKNNRQQLRDNKLTDEQLREDTDTINAVCDLYDSGITLKLLKKMYQDIEVYRDYDE